MDDLISRQAAIDYFVTNVGWNDEDGYPIEDSDKLREIWTDLFNGVPSAQPERKKGHYIGEADGYADGELVYDIWSCSECGCHFEDWDEEPTYNFCPNCGADMRGEE